MFEQIIRGLPDYVIIIVYLSVAISFSLFAYYLLKSGKGNLPVTQAPISVKGAARPESFQQDCRYVEKKAARKDKDVNRFGRWMLKLYNKKKVVKVGFLYTVLASTPSVRTYKEIQ